MEELPGKIHGYIRDEPYIYGYYPETLPESMLGNVLGRPGRPKDDFRYLDLGCGFGVTSSLLAALYPCAEVVQLDFNPVHIASIQAFNSSSGLDNAIALQRDIFSLESGELGEFDFVSGHGLLSWIAEDVRAALFSFLRGSLKPDALVFFSYLTPRLDPRLTAFRTTLYRTFAAASGGSLDRLHRALESCLVLLQEGSWPGLGRDEARELLLQFMERSPRYLLHEFLNDDWCPIDPKELRRCLTADDLSSRFQYEEEGFQSGYCREVFGKGDVTKLLHKDVTRYSHYLECIPGKRPVLSDYQAPPASVGTDDKPAAGIYLHEGSSAQPLLLSSLSRYNRTILDSRLSDEKSFRPLAIAGAGQGLRLTPVQQEIIRAFLVGRVPTAILDQLLLKRGLGDAVERHRTLEGAPEPGSPELSLLEFLSDRIPYSYY